MYYLALHIDFDSKDGKKFPGGAEGIAVDEQYEAVPFNLGDFLYKDIYINGKHINNWQLYRPFVTVEGEIFVPVSDAVKTALGLEVEFIDEKHVINFKPSGDPSMQTICEDTVACNLQYIEVFWGHEYYINGELRSGEILAATKKPNYEGDERGLYVSLECLKRYSGLDFSYYYDEISGLYISTQKYYPAESYYSENNAKYIEGRARFMVEKGKNVDFETALWYEYLFRHEASRSEYLDEDLLMGICMVESRFDTYAQSKANAVGLLQILYKYAAKSDYSEEMLKDPHYNVEYSAGSLIDGFQRAKGDKVLCLTAYNMGYYALQAKIKNGEKYSTAYADKCIYYEDMIKYWVQENGYSKDFNVL